jgi:aspartyl protease family protein
MRTPLLVPLLAGLLAAVLSGSHVMAGQRPPGIVLMSVTELKANKAGHFITQATINGNDVTVLVDTGATAVALSWEDADNVGLRPSTLDFNVPVSTANGVAQAARVAIDRIEIDGVKVDNVDGLVLPQGALRGTLLGMSFLGRLRSFKVEDGVLVLRD